MPNTYQTPSASSRQDTGFTPDHPRVARLNHLADDITELAAHLDAGAFRLLQLIGEFDKEEGWAGQGIRSCAHWLNWKCGMSLGSARERVRVAKALPALPAISAAFRKGKVSYSKVRAMTRVATPDNESALLQVALHGTAHHVETQVRLYRRVKRIEALEEENLRHGHRELVWHVDDEGYWLLRGRFTAEQGAVLQKALEAAGDELFEEQKNVPAVVAAEIDGNIPLDSITPEPVSQKRADALLRVAEGFLAGGGRPRNDQAGGDRYMINLHTDAETLKADGSGVGAELEEHGHVPAETCRRLACDCARVDWREDGGGEPLSVGRKTRSIPPAIRRALKRRDQGCRFPGCTCTRYVDAHHILHWADGGETSMDNLVLLCRTHHRLVHEAGYGVCSVGGEGAVFSLPDGTVIPQTPETRSRGNVFALLAGNQKSGLNITPETAVPEWHGEQMDKETAVEMLLLRE